MRYILLLVLSLPWLGLPRAALAGQIVLMEGGQARYSVAAKEPASEPETFAADELRRYLGMIGGGPLEKAGAGAPVIHVGVESAQVKAILEGRAEDSFVVLTSGNDLYLTGNTPRATLYAVYYLLEKYLGCGWLQPGDDEVPHLSTVALPDFIHDVEEPRFSQRSVNLYPYTPERAIPRIDWAAKNRLNWVHVCTNGSNHWEAFDSRKTFIPELRKRGLRLNYGGHTFSTWVPPAKYFDTHPEYFSLIDGKRDPAQLNIANPEVARVAASEMDRFLQQNPEVEMIDMWLNDTTKFDDSAAVKKMEGQERTSIYGTITGKDLKTRTNANIRFVNAVAEQVAQRHPRVLVQTLAYFQLIDAPTVKPGPNVMVGFAPISRMPSRYTEDRTGYWYPLTEPGHQVNALHLRELEKWLAITPPGHFFTYEYYSHVTTSKGMVGVNTSTDDLLHRLIDPSKKGFHVYTSAIAADIQLYSEIGMQGVGSEDWDWDELNMYLYPRLMWHPELSSNAVIADYCHRSYGKAALPMLRHWLVLQDAREKFRAYKDLALQHLKEAEKIQVSPAERRRIEAVEETWTHIP